MWNWGHRAGARKGRRSEGVNLRCRAVQAEGGAVGCEDKPTSMAAGSPQGRGPGGPGQSRRGCGPQPSGAFSLGALE